MYMAGILIPRSYMEYRGSLGVWAGCAHTHTHTHTGPRYLTVDDGAGLGKKETGFELGAGSYR